MAYHIQSFVIPPFYENTYLVYNDEKKAILIDPGCITEKEKQELLHFIDKQQLHLQYIWLTHTHFDHIFGLQFFTHHFNLKPHLHIADLPTLEYAYVMSKQMNMPLERYEGDFSLIDEKTTFFEKEETIKILHLPGHSPGSVGFYNEHQQFIISGDVLFHHSIGRTDLKYADYPMLEKSIQQKLYTLPDNTIVYCGHNQHTTIGEEKKKNPFVKSTSFN